MTRSDPFVRSCVFLNSDSLSGRPSGAANGFILTRCCISFSSSLFDGVFAIRTGLCFYRMERKSDRVRLLSYYEVESLAENV